MPTINGKKYIDQALAQIKTQTAAGKKVAVTFDIDNETKFSGDHKVDEETPVWKVDVK